jgi:RimJ/RimL family protein N-acetyltransferase
MTGSRGAPEDLDLDAAGRLALDAIVTRELTVHDRASVLAGLQALSRQSLIARFGGPVDPRAPSLTSWIAELDGRARVAYGACERRTARPVGVARYVALAVPQTVEVAVTVVDAWQGRGVGKLLLRRLADHAGAHGVRRFYARAFSNSPAPHTLMMSLGGRLSLRQSWGVTELTLDLLADRRHPPARMSPTLVRSNAAPAQRQASCDDASSRDRRGRDQKRS